MSQPNSPSSPKDTLATRQQALEEDIQALRDARSPQTLEEKVADWKAHGIDPAKTFDTRGDEDQD